MCESVVCEGRTNLFQKTCVEMSRDLWLSGRGSAEGTVDPMRDGVVETM